MKLIYGKNDYKVIFFGEKHGIKENFDYYLKYIKKFSENENLTILFEVGYSAGVYINEFIKGNEIIPLNDFVLNFKNTLFGSWEFKEFIIKLKEFSEISQSKLNFIGIDIEHQVNIAKPILEFLKSQKRKKDIKHIKRNLKYIKKISEANNKRYEKLRELYLCKNFLKYYNSEKNHICFMGSYHTKLELNVKNLIKYVENKKIPFLTVEVMYINSKRTIKQDGIFKEITVNDEINENECYNCYDIYILKNDERIGKIIIKNAEALKML